MTTASVVGLVFASSALGADGDDLWHPEGEDVSPFSAPVFATASDEGGGVFVVWDEGPGIRAQLLDATGTPQWASPGVQLSSTGSAPAIFAQSPWGATMAWEESTGIYVQRLDYSGTPLWAAGGVQVGTSGEVPVLVHIPGPGFLDPPGALIAWGEAVRVAAVDGTGTVTAPGVDGISLGGSVRLPLPDYLRMITDDSGGAIVVWANFAKDIVAQRVNAGLPWGSVPTVVSSDFRDEGPLGVVPDGAGGAVISWSATQLIFPPANGQVRVQRIDPNGTSLWTTNGVVVVDSAVVGGSTAAWSTSELGSDVASDGSGGAIVAWNDWRNEAGGGGNDDIYAQRVNSGGLAQWTLNGVLLPPFIQGSTAPGSQRGVRTVSDRRGGAIVTYQDAGPAPVNDFAWDISVTRLDANGNKHFSQYAYVDVNQGNEDQIGPEVVFDGSGPSPPGAVITWVDQARGPGSLYAVKVEISGPANDAFAFAEPVVAGSLPATLLGATQDGDSGCGGGGGADVWYVFAPPGLGTLEVDTCGTHDLGGVDTGMDSVVSIHSAVPGSAANEIACNDDWPAGGIPPGQCAASDASTPRDSATAAALLTLNPVWIRVSHFPSSSPDDFVLNVRFLPEPGGLLLLVTGLAGLVAMRWSPRYRA